ncbi:unnamed protein product [Gongylonema pulchrum]|uniref:TAZ-type domain-containing protein n=1 Tax=Gongylonema pulchrum TaxID=637853 RepID=A0A183D3H9_9BILA|nr:unnamed protein product [Gongylonema pulchrum]
MVCPKMETCSEQCFREDVLHVNSCAKKRCNIHCFDGDCPHCISVTKRIFLRICREYDVTNLPNVKFDGSCKDLFDYVLKEYVRSQTT